MSDDRRRAAREQEEREQRETMEFYAGKQRRIEALEAQLAACRNALRASESRHASDSEVFEQRLDTARADAAAARGKAIEECAKVADSFGPVWTRTQSSRTAQDIAREIRALDAAGRAAGEVA